MLVIYISNSSSHCTKVMLLSVGLRSKQDPEYRDIKKRSSVKSGSELL